MKLKHLLFSGVFTALLAFGLLTLALPQNVQAVQPEATITCDWRPTQLSPLPLPVSPPQPATRVEAKRLCDAATVFCLLDGSNNPIGHQLVCSGCR